MSAEHVTDDELLHRLADWATYLADEHGDLTREQWAHVDALLDELARRLEHGALDLAAGAPL